MESRTGFSQGPLSALELSKDPPKDKDFNRFWKASLYVILPLHKKIPLLETDSHFSHIRGSPQMCMQSH